MTRRVRSGWRRGRPNVKGSDWIHESGWEVRHCGHPTATWPFYLVDPSQPQWLVVSFNGLGFKHLVVAQTVVERLVRGEATVTRDRCDGACARVPEFDAGGDRVEEAA